MDINIDIFIKFLQSDEEILTKFVEFTAKPTPVFHCKNCRTVLASNKVFCCRQCEWDYC